MENKKVLLGMSGGVDSSVSAVLLQKAGYEVVGITMELFKEDKKVSTNNVENNNLHNMNAINNSPENDAKSICNYLNLEHHITDCKEEFNNYVIQDFIKCYSNCKTPNPCIECNKYMKFGLMYEEAKKLGCNYIATGHYAKTEYSEKYNRWVIRKSNAGKKDQTYVLWSINKELIEHILFPLADFENKDEIREIARENNLQVANKPDSEDICFVPDGNYKDFLEKNSEIKPKQGNIVDLDGKVLGKHNGLYNYTIGQRKGLGISNPVPLFVLGFNKERNQVIVGEEKDLYKKEILVSDINLLLVDEINEYMEVEVKTRYSAKSAKARIKQEENNIRVIFEEPQRAITPGQSAVFYVDDILLGGGKIV